MKKDSITIVEPYLAHHDTFFYSSRNFQHTNRLQHHFLQLGLFYRFTIKNKIAHDFFIIIKRHAFLKNIGTPFLCVVRSLSYFEKTWVDMITEKQFVSHMCSFLKRYAARLYMLLPMYWCSSASTSLLVSIMTSFPWSYDPSFSQKRILHLLWKQRRLQFLEQTLSHTIMEMCSCLEYVQYFTVLWYKILHQSTNVLKVVNQHILPCICYDKFSMTIWLHSLFKNTILPLTRNS